MNPMQELVASLQTLISESHEHQNLYCLLSSLSKLEGNLEDLKRVRHALWETVWKHPGGRLVGMAWTDDQILVCVVQDGTIYRYNLHAELQEPNISMGTECFEQGVAECIFWGNGMVCITDANQLFCVPDFKNPKPCKLTDPCLDEAPL